MLYIERQDRSVGKDKRIVECASARSDRDRFRQPSHLTGEHHGGAQNLFVVVAPGPAEVHFVGTGTQQRGVHHGTVGHVHLVHADAAHRGQFHPRLHFREGIALRAERKGLDFRVEWPLWRREYCTKR